MTTPKKRRRLQAGVPAHNTLYTCFSHEKDADHDRVARFAADPDVLDSESTSSPERLLGYVVFDYVKYDSCHPTLSCRMLSSDRDSFWSEYDRLSAVDETARPASLIFNTLVNLRKKQLTERKKKGKLTP